MFGRKEQKVDSNHVCIIMDNKILERVIDIKFLGIYIDENLNWKRQVSELCLKLSKFIGMLNRVKYFLSKSSLKMLYDSLI